MLGRAIYESWPLFLGMLLLMLSNGLLVTLLTLQASALGFSQTSISVMQAAYPLGALFGCIIAPKIVAQVGHARSFGALASLCSTAALVHLGTVDPVSWTAMRGLAGFCFPGLYVVAESWLNGRASNETRAALLSVYFIIQIGGIAAGQLFLSIPDAGGTLLFVIVSAMISLSLVPMLLSPTRGRDFVAPGRLGLMDLLKVSPLGFAVTFLNGLSQGAFYVGLGLFGVAVGLADNEVGFLFAAGAVGGMLSQFPIGSLSDRVDRRIVIAAVAILAFLACLGVAVYTMALQGGIGLYAAIGIIGAFMLPIYSLAVAHTNDRLQPSEMVAASGALVLVLNVGAVMGPLAGGIAISIFGAPGLFFLLAGVQAATGGVALARLMAGGRVAAAPGPAAPVSHAATPVATRLNPEAQE